MLLSGMLRLTHKDKTRLERLARDQLLGAIVNYGPKKFYNIVTATLPFNR
jgi:hypothetical protein